MRPTLNQLAQLSFFFSQNKLAPSLFKQPPHYARFFKAFFWSTAGPKVPRSSKIEKN